MNSQQELARIIEESLEREGPLLPALHAIQEHFGYIPPELEPELASALNLSVAEVRGVISFYHDFRTSPPGKHRVRICCAEACQSRGSRTLADHVRARLGVDFGATTGDGRISLEKVYCLGNCACGPSVDIDERVHANVNPSRFDDILAPLAAEYQA